MLKKLQEGLRKLKYFKAASTTNNFGAATEAAVKAFQKNSGLKVSGVADKTTLSKLSSLLKTGVANLDMANPKGKL